MVDFPIDKIVHEAAPDADIRFNEFGRGGLQSSTFAENLETPVRTALERYGIKPHVSFKNGGQMQVVVTPEDHKNAVERYATGERSGWKHSI